MRDASAIMTIADHEGLWAHAQSVRLRTKLAEQEVINGAAE